MDHSGSSGRKWTERTEVDQNGLKWTKMLLLEKKRKKNFNYIYFIYRNIVLGFFHLLLRINVYWFPLGYNASDSDTNESKGKSK